MICFFTIMKLNKCQTSSSLSILLRLLTFVPLVVLILLVNVVLSAHARVKIGPRVEYVLLHHPRDLVVFAKSIDILHEVPSRANHSIGCPSQRAHCERECEEGARYKRPLPVSEAESEGCKRECIQFRIHLSLVQCQQDGFVLFRCQTFNLC